MLKKVYIVLFLFSALSLMVPPYLFASTPKAKSKTSCCKTKSSHQKACCKKSATKQDQQQNKKNCDGNCGKPTCNCSCSLTNSTIPVISSIAGIELKVNRSAKQKAGEIINPHLCKGFHTIWQPPKVAA